MKKKGNWAIAEDYTDDLHTRVMLFRMMVVQIGDDADIIFDDRNPYAVRNYDYWRKALCVKSDGPVKKALKNLRRAGIMETVRKKQYGNVLLHVRLAVNFTEKHGLSGTKLNPVGHNMTNGPGIIYPTEEAQMNQPYISKKNSKKNSMKQSAKKIRKEILGKSETVLEDSKPTFDNARKVWSVYWHKYQDGPVDGFPQSPKVRKMYRDWVSKVPSDQSPLYLIARALQHWSEFRDEVKSDTGKPIPDYPTLVYVIWNLPSLLRISPHIEEPVKPSPASDAPLNATEKMDLEIKEGPDKHPKFLTKGIWQK